MNFKLHFSLVALTSFLCLQSCIGLFDSEKDNNSDPEGEEIIDEGLTARAVNTESEGEVISMPGNAVFVRDDANSHLEEYDETTGILVFEENKAIADVAVKEGDILYSGPVESVAPEGYIVKVKRVETASGKTVISTEPAGLFDAFDHVETQVPLDMDLFDPERDLVFYDIMMQGDLNDSTEIEPSAKEYIPTKGVDLSELKLSKEAYDIKYDKEHHKLSATITIIDFDKDYSTKKDQVKLVLTFVPSCDYAFLFGDKEANNFSAGLKLGLDYSATISYSYPYKKNLDNKDRFMEHLEKEFFGKKKELFSVDIPIGKAAEFFVKPRFKVYVTAGFDAKGSIALKFGIENAELDLRVMNDNTRPASLDRDHSWFNISCGDPVFNIECEAEAKAEAAFGVGLTLSLPRLVSNLVLLNGNNYIGFFCDIVNGSISSAPLSLTYDAMNNATTVKESLTAKVSTKGYFEGYAKMRNGFEFTFKADAFDKEWWKKTWDLSFKWSPEEPVAYGISPAQRSITSDDSVMLTWDVAGGTDVSKNKFTYDVYFGTDADAVDNLAPDCLIGRGFQTKECRVNMKEESPYYWKVLTRTEDGETYFGTLNSYDYGSASFLALGDGLARYFDANPAALPGIYVSKGGHIRETPANIKALKEMTSLTINDSDGKYDIKSIDELLSLMPNLTNLDCGFNSLQTLDLSCCPNLKTLSCSHNNLTSLSLASNRELTTLACGNNPQLEYLYISNCPALQSLFCNSCSLGTVDLSGNPKLTVIDASVNRMTYLDISPCIGIGRLNVKSQSGGRLRLELLSSQLGRNTDSFSYDIGNTDLMFKDIAVHTEYPTAISAESITIKVRLDGRADILEKGILYTDSYDPSAETINLTVSSGKKVVASSSTADGFTATATGLQSHCNIAIRGYVIIKTPFSDFVVYGNILELTTSEEGQDAVDLGLSVKWASCNLGASQANEKGSYYSWGGTASKTTYDWDSYELANGSSTTLQKYMWHRDNGGLDGLSKLKPEDDAAFQRLGGAWHVPTDREWRELKDNCSWSYVNRNDSTGFVVRGKNGNEIFLPFTGYFNGDGLSNTSGGYYWSSTLYRTSSTTANYQLANVYYIEQRSMDRCQGLAIRPVNGIKPAVNTVEVDLGLSVKWANCNLGAEQIEDPGLYYGWGETEDKLTYDWSTYSLCDGSENRLEKYVWHRANSPSNDIDGKSALENEDDIARQTLKGKWRIPTDREWRELRDKCSWKWTSINYQNGFMVTGPNGNSIFLPVTSYRTGDGFDEGNNNGGYYWSRNLYRTSSTTAHYQLMNVYYIEERSMARCNGLAIRPVSADDIPISIETVDMGLSVEWANCNVGATAVEDPGLYYAWGDLNDRLTYDWESYSLSKGSSTSLTKYVWHRENSYNNDIDCLSHLEYCDDAARYNMKHAWRMPTDKEWHELRDSCRWEWTSINYQNGFKVTGPSGNSIFLPVTSYRTGDGFDEGNNNGGYYWSSNLYRTSSTTAHYQLMNVYYIEERSMERFNGLAIRPVVGEPAITENKAVDMGLSVKWSNINLGAKSKSDPGEFYAWGEVKPKHTFGWETYGLADKSPEMLKKYIWHRENSADGTVDDLSMLEPEDDAASRRLGGGWRIPTERDWQELHDNCSWEWTSINYQNGFKVTAKNGNWIFLPSTSYRTGDGFDEGNNSGGYYWTNSLYRTSSTTARYHLSNVYYNEIRSMNRCMGLAIRPVLDEVADEPLHSEDLGLSVKWGSCNVGAMHPEDPGDYFAWGETRPKYEYSWETYSFSNSDGTSFTEYMWPNGSRNPKEEDPILLDTWNDAAYKNCGSIWRIPTDEEWNELSSKCSWKWTTKNYQRGFLITGPNENSIFLPVTSYRSDYGFDEGNNSGCYYWSRNLSDSNSAQADYKLSNVYYNEIRRMNRCNGLAIRPVRE